ncbi:manganese-dependent inorganic pyrophosphatase [bacterium]|nr:manganese-dependent inorganic pyrophosphatase [bacterium]
MSEKIYVIGHKSPDLDTVAGAIAYASLKNIIEKTDLYTPVITGNINKETEYVLNKFDFKKPEILENASGKKVVLVDHNEFSQAVDGIEEAEILEVVDHHKVNFSYGQPISFNVLPWGASCSIITQKYFDYNLEINENLSGLMLSAILIDTVITKSPTCTESDIRIIDQLSKLSKIENWEDFGIEIFKIRSSVNVLSPREIIKSDYKDFNTNSGVFGVGQVETADLDEFEEKEDEILKELEEIKKEGDYHSVILLLTDIIKEGSKLFVASDNKKKLGQVFNVDLVNNNKVFISGLMSRKKQVAPKIEKSFN